MIFRAMCHLAKDAVLDSAGSAETSKLHARDAVPLSGTDDHEALNNWGNALSDQAKTKSDDEADRLFALAGEKYEQALAIKPDMHTYLGRAG